MMSVGFAFIVTLLIVVSCCSLLLSPLLVTSQTFEIDAVAGYRFYDGEGGLATHVRIFAYNVAFHPVTDEVFIADTNNHVIRKIDKASGVITTVAGTPEKSGFSGDGGPAKNAQLSAPRSIAFDQNGTIMYIADTGNSVVRMVRDGIITTVAGNGTYGFGGDDVQATSTPLTSPYGVTVLPTTGELVFSDTYNQRIRKVDSTGVISTIAGTGTRTDVGGAPLGDNGPATNATLSNPIDIVANSIGEIFIADQNNYRIRKIGTDGVITTIAGTGVHGFSGDNGPATGAQVGTIYGLAVDSFDNIFVADTSKNCIRKVDNTTQIIVSVAGICGFGGYSGDNALAITAQFSTPSGVAVSSKGEVVIVDHDNSRIRKIATNSIISTIAGNGVRGFSGGSGIAIDALLNYPTSVAVTNNGEVFISGYVKIRKVDRNGIITTVAGNGLWNFGGDGGSALDAMLSDVRGIVVTDTGDVLVADTGNNRIRKVFRNGTIVTIAGNGNTDFSGDGVLATDTALNQPRSVAYMNGDVYITDTDNHRIRKIFTNGTITTIAGNGTYGYSGDGDLAIHAMLNRPVSVVVNDAGEVFISEEVNQIVRKIDTKGIITTFAGTPGVDNYSGDGSLATNATLNRPRGLRSTTEESF